MRPRRRVPGASRPAAASGGRVGLCHPPVRRGDGLGQPTRSSQLHVTWHEKVERRPDGGGQGSQPKPTRGGEERGARGGPGAVSSGLGASRSRHLLSLKCHSPLASCRGLVQRFFCGEREKLGTGAACQARAVHQRTPAGGCGELPGAAWARDGAQGGAGEARGHHGEMQTSPGVGVTLLSTSCSPGMCLEAPAAEG